MYIFNVPKIEGEIVMLKSTLFFSIRLKKWTQTKNKNKKMNDLISMLNTWNSTRKSAKLNRD